ncbi:zinc finger BED domain-containing protein RICESLEEPER 2-like [Papaver somniferum]|uniref:zinc finger BED domain-containing protein RICESLEEPER 2-like n=1 Tax=Papaver somniferum TaxID=3469 RepID=UPI000E6FAA5E|nr:zinc finger BED domain-containing protein RICESLEEPER 2-like [Papaver somniferum]
MVDPLDGSTTVDCAPAPVSGEKEHKLRSDVWEYFDLIKYKDGSKKGVCKACKVGYKYDSQKGGTSSMKRQKCRERHSQDIWQMILSSKNGQLSSRLRKIYQMKFQDLISELLIARNVPLALVEWKEFRDICGYLNEDAKPLSRNTGKADIVKKHNAQKEVIRNILKLAPGRMCLTSDMWTSVTTTGYISLTVHFVNQNWELKKYLLNFCELPPPHTDGLVKIDPVVLKLRKSVKSLKKSQVRKQKFLDIVDTLGMSAVRRGVRQDVKTRWNSTYLMLDSCLVYRSVFAHLKEVDSDYTNFPTDEEWDQIEVVTKFLKTFYDLTTLFSGSKYPTSNLYFEGVCQVQVLLKKESTNEIEFIGDMVKEMQEKFNSYWENLSPILAMALVLDPRLKLKYLNFDYSKLYPDVRQLESKVSYVREDMKKLYNEYYTLSRASGSGTQNFGIQTGANSAHQGSEWIQEYVAAQESGGDLQSDLSELDQYLSEKYGFVNQPLDILMYWKAQEQRFPVLSRMAGDILSIPISTVASESAFSIGGRVIDRFRSSLLPENAEAFITTRDWKHGVGEEDMDEDNGIIGEDVLGFELGPVEDRTDENGEEVVINIFIVALGDTKYKVTNNGITTVSKISLVPMTDQPLAHSVRGPDNSAHYANDLEWKEKDDAVKWVIEKSKEKIKNCRIHIQKPKAKKVTKHEKEEDERLSKLTKEEREKEKEKEKEDEEWK